MSLAALIQPFLWSRYSKKLAQKIENPRNYGFFSAKESQQRGVRLIEGREGSIEEGNEIVLFWLVDPDDGIIIDARYQAFGQTALIGAAEVACELCIGKNYDQAKRISGDLLDKQVRDRSDEAAFPKETFPHINLVLSAMENAAEQCKDIPLPHSYAAPPMPSPFGNTQEGHYPGWEELDPLQQINVIEQVIAEDIRPYIELDAGGVEVKKIEGNFSVIIAYKGSCTSCFSATGTTLSYIQQILRTKIHPQISVIPDLSNFSF